MYPGHGNMRGEFTGQLSQEIRSGLEAPTTDLLAYQVPSSWALLQRGWNTYTV